MAIGADAAAGSIYASALGGVESHDFVVTVNRIPSAAILLDRRISLLTEAS